MKFKPRMIKLIGNPVSISLFTPGLWPEKPREELSMLSITPKWAPSFQDPAARDWWRSDVLIERLLSRATMSLITISGASIGGFRTLNWYLFPAVPDKCWIHTLGHDQVVLHFCAARRPSADLWSEPTPAALDEGRERRLSWWDQRRIGFSDLEAIDETLHCYTVVPKTARERDWLEEENRDLERLEKIFDGFEELNRSVRVRARRTRT
jgi:hypothetical protein